MFLLAALLIGALSIILPGFFLSLALLRKAGLNMFEIVAIGIIFGLIFPPSLVWLESFLIPYIHQFTFSYGLYNINVVVLTIAGILLSWQQGAFDSISAIPRINFGSPSKFKEEVDKDYRKRISTLRNEMSNLKVDIRIIREHQTEEDELARRHQNETHMLKDVGPEEKARIEEEHRNEERKLFEAHELEERKLLNKDSKSSGVKINPTFAILAVLMIITFMTRIENIAAAPHYFEFDPYYDMISTQYILVHGYQLLFDNAAWPGHIAVSIHRLQPIVPYLEAYWYDIANTSPGGTSVDTTLLSLVGSYYPPLVAALLVFVVFMLIYHEYGEFPAIIGAALASAMPALLSAFIAGEQLLEPWGIFSMFFFYAAYLLAVNNMKEKRFAILAGIAFASNFLGAHYYTVTAGVLAIYIVFQGVLNVMRKQDNADFYKMNAIVIAIIAVSYLIYNAYGATLTERTSAILHIPIIIALPLFALLGIALLEFIPVLAKKRGFVKDLSLLTYISWLAIIVIASLVAVFFTPLGKPVLSYLQLSQHFTSPSIALFMTVQEYAPTGLNYDFGSAGFGIIGASIGGVDLLIWLALIAFVAAEGWAIYKRNSQLSVLAMAAVLPLAFAGMTEVKYLPHFGVGYIIAICAILGELLIYINKPGAGKNNRNIIYGFGIVIAAAELLTTLPAVAFAYGSSCSSITNHSNVIGATMFCNTVPQYWLAATSWMKQNVGPYGPRILAWWDYGDWINWFGNSNAFLRGDNAVAKLDYATAARFVLGPQDNYGPAALASFMNGNQSKYVLFDDQLVPKWGALDFLACVNVNQTSRAYALSQGVAQGSPYVLGTSPCELSHDPALLFVPLSQNVNNYCSFTNSSLVALKGIMVIGNSATNQTFCVPVSFFNTGNPTYIYDQNGTKQNIFVSASFIEGETSIGGQTYIDMLAIYTPNGPNSTITDSPSEFYNSTYYQGFFLGRLKGFTLAYPKNFTGMNFYNSSHLIMIYSLDNYTGGTPNVTAKYPWIENNYTMPG